jgi:hypothetical protein
LGQLLTLIILYSNKFEIFINKKEKKINNLGEAKGGNLQEYSIYGNENFQN